MKLFKFIKNNWLVLSLLAICPIVINYIILIPNFLPIVGDNTLWLSFFGSFVGSALMAGITLYVLQEQLIQNHSENEQNRTANERQNIINRDLSLNLRKQELDLKWFEDLKSASIQLDLAFNNNDVTATSDLDPLSEKFNEKVTFLMSRMNEAYFNFQLTINYHNDNGNTSEMQRITQYTKEYLSLLSDMNSLHIFGNLLNKGLEDIDYLPEDFDTRFKEYILTQKEKLEFPEITLNRIWDLLIDEDFSSLGCIRKIMDIIRKRIDNFHMIEVGTSITSLLKAEYRNIHNSCLKD